jgi:hypothetical protein
MTRHRTLSIAAILAASLLLATLASNVRAQASDGSRSAVEDELNNLKAAYLRCDQAATERLLGFDEAASCSILHERLLKVGFGGDFKRLLAWWQAERAKTRGERVATP